MLVPLLAAAAVLALSFSYSKLRYIRFRQYAHFPQLPNSLVLGHLKVFGEFIKRNKPNAHEDLAIVAMNRALGRPPLMLIDMRPISKPIVVVGDYEIADQLTKASKLFPTSPPKSASSVERLLHLNGPTSILFQHGEEWRRLRKKFNPGFAPQYLVTFVPDIVEKGMIFLERLDAFCKTGDAFPLMALTTRLTFDVIGKVVMETDLDGQYDDKTKKGEIVDLFETLLDAYNGDRGNLPWWLNIRNVKRRSALANRIASLLRTIVYRKHVELHEKGAATTTSNPRSVLSLGLRDIETLTPSVADEISDQLRTFLFAGHDTTSILLSWAFYELSRTPHALRTIRAELDDLLGRDASPAAVRARLLEQEDLVQRMPFVSAVIKETLRLHPPGGTAREIPAGSGFAVRTPDGEQRCLDGLLVYNCQSIIHRDPRVFGDTAEDFVPERWLDDDAKIPPGAWRPFERGPRNCIGLELANVEARVILALAVRRYDFVKVGLGEVVLGEDGRPSLDSAKAQYKVAEELYTTRQVTSKPVDGMMMKVRLAK
ncbi:cytochrome P450 [Annulohypoxylon truncatum]|uniref:cytochrome P450 n=1 Tax=Annulohypoxylon truncatum TaxID=327061 RepID=UPI00200753F8|nr:cytochrome P450 [Annulohypoxylon truncatum]KAI1204237.1 cytochrome P450 [Annulohypoxylon truncatum]